MKQVRKAKSSDDIEMTQQVKQTSEGDICPVMTTRAVMMKLHHRHTLSKHASIDHFLLLLKDSQDQPLELCSVRPSKSHTHTNTHSAGSFCDTSVAH